MRDGDGGTGQGAGSELHGLLDDLEAAADGRERIPLGALLGAIGPRGFGPILVLLSLAIILPTGMIPLLPHVVAVVLGFVAVELALGSRALRLPRRLREVGVPARHVRAFAARARPLAARIGRVLRPRNEIFAATRTAHLALAGILFLAALLLFAVGLIPGLPFLLCVPVLLIGLGLTARDGNFAAAGALLFLMPMGAILSWGTGIATGRIEVVVEGLDVELVMEPRRETGEDEADGGAPQWPPPSP